MNKFTEFELNTIEKGWKFYHKNINIANLSSTPYTNDL